MAGYVGNIEEATLKNTFFRQVIFTAPNSQLVLMSLPPGEEIGEEVHPVDQFFRIEQGQAKVVIAGEVHNVKNEFAIVVPANTKHNVINTGQVDLKLYTIYSPPHHKDNVIHRTKAEALADEEDHV
jgi:mannose-6-phosphate isomerase-like protein (cupin superfamily)